MIDVFSLHLQDFPAQLDLIYKHRHGNPFMISPKLIKSYLLLGLARNP